ncbi:response regulator transcription factor [Actinomycetes bacterium NPDC127524]
MIRIVIAEDQEMLLVAISSLLNFEEDIEVVGLASNGEEALTMVHELQPDICMMDIEMPKKSGLDAAEALQPFEYRVIILTTFSRNGYFRRALKANVRGYLLKDSPSDVLASSIRGVMDGKRIYSPELIDDASAINEQEMEVSGLMADSLNTNKASNQQNNLIGTARKYLSAIKCKMKLPAG